MNCSSCGVSAASCRDRALALSEGCCEACDHAPVPDPDTAGPEGGVVEHDQGWGIVTHSRAASDGCRWCPSPPEASPDTGREALREAWAKRLRAAYHDYPSVTGVSSQCWLRAADAVLAALSRSPERATADNDSKGEQR